MITVKGIMEDRKKILISGQMKEWIQEFGAWYDSLSLIDPRKKKQKEVRKSKK